MDQKTTTFSLYESTGVKNNLNIVYNALQEKGYDPINQLIGYILSEDPTYITSYNNARSIITKMDKYDILTDLVKNYFE